MMTELNKQAVMPTTPFQQQAQINVLNAPASSIPPVGALAKAGAVELRRTIEEMLEKQAGPGGFAAGARAAWKHPMRNAVLRDFGLPGAAGLGAFGYDQINDLRKGQYGGWNTIGSGLEGVATTALLSPAFWRGGLKGPAGAYMRGKNISPAVGKALAMPLKYKAMIGGTGLGIRLAPHAYAGAADIGDKVQQTMANLAQSTSVPTHEAMLPDGTKKQLTDAQYKKLGLKDEAAADVGPLPPGTTFRKLPSVATNLQAGSSHLPGAGAGLESTLQNAGKMTSATGEGVQNVGELAKMLTSGGKWMGDQWKNPWVKYPAMGAGLGLGALGLRKLYEALKGEGEEIIGKKPGFGTPGAGKRKPTRVTLKKPGQYNIFLGEDQVPPAEGEQKAAGVKRAYILDPVHEQIEKLPEGGRGYGYAGLYGPILGAALGAGYGAGAGHPLSSAVHGATRGGGAALGGVAGAHLVGQLMPNARSGSTFKPNDLGGNKALAMLLASLAGAGGGTYLGGKLGDAIMGEGGSRGPARQDVAVQEKAGHCGLGGFAAQLRGEQHISP